MPAEQDDCGQRRGANDPLQHAQPKDLSAPGVLGRSIVLAINVMAVCAKALMIKYPKYSKFNAAAIPATALEPKLFTAVWRQILEMENTVDWTAAGTPIRTTLFSRCVLILNWWKSSRMLSLSWHRIHTMIPVLTILERTVAIAVPATPKWSTMTRNRLRNTFRTPDIIRQNIGRLVSPMLRNTAEIKLYRVIKGNARQ